MRTRTLALPLALVALAGCAKQEESSTSKAEPTGAAPAWMLTAAPADALEIAAAKAEVAEGDAIVLHGRIGGRMDAMSSESPTFVMMDLEIPSCADMGDEDHCPTPWDYCCEPQESITENIATVLVVDETGAPVAESLEAAGLAPLDEVIVVGTVDARPDPAVLTVRATAIHRIGG